MRDQDCPRPTVARSTDGRLRFLLTSTVPRVAMAPPKLVAEEGDARSGGQVAKGVHNIAANSQPHSFKAQMHRAESGNCGERHRNSGEVLNPLLGSLRAADANNDRPGRRLTHDEAEASGSEVDSRPGPAWPSARNSFCRDFIAVGLRVSVASTASSCRARMVAKRSYPGGMA